MSESAETTNQVSAINEETVSQDELAPLPEVSFKNELILRTYKL